MHPLRCCRFCLQTNKLNSIFTFPEHSEKYTDIIFTITGMKVTLNDGLPQEICSKCTEYFNTSIKFRKMCEDASTILSNYKFNDNIPLPLDYKTEECTSINIFSTNDIDFNDFDDNITLDTLKNENVEEKPNYNMDVDSKTSQNSSDLMFDKKRKPARRKNGVQSKKDKEEKKEEIKCEHCHKILTSKLSLRNHYKIHTGFDVVCEHCGKKFITRRLLLMHCRAKHGYEKTDKCSYCDYRASNAEQVKIHERLHTGEKPYVCKDCNAGFHRKSSYLQHIAIHLPEKTVQCDQCPARFKSVTLMRIHKNRHRAPQYRYKCAICDNSFARRRNAARHLQRVHGLSPDHHIHRHTIH